jgi:Na+-transporting NADH:ubiquinone oxidoreductase subunit C
MDRNSNSYILIYVAVMVVIVAFVLAFTAGALKERQERNIEIDKKRQILAALNVESTARDAEALFERYVKEVIVVNYRGELVEGINGFTIELQREKRKSAEERFLPIYIAEKNGKTFYVFALHGAGLWGPIWGYIALKEDRSTVYGAHFSHKAETPGLGSEIADRPFQMQFQGKEIFRNGVFKSVAVIQPGKSVDGIDFVDGISGGTITSHAVDRILFNNLEWYKPFITINN